MSKDTDWETRAREVLVRSLDALESRLEGASTAECIRIVELVAEVCGVAGVAGSDPGEE